MGMSRGAILLAVCLATLVAPALPSVAVALVPVGSSLELVLLVAAATAWMTVLALVAWWEFTGLALRWGWWAVLTAAVAVRSIRTPTAGASLGPTGIGVALGLLVAIAVLVPALRARVHPGEALAIHFPLRGGRFLVTDGGDGATSFLVNYHYRFAGHRGSGVSASMRYAMDVVEVGALGIEAPWLLPARNEAYRIWGRPVHAPCDGVVAHVAAEVADNTAFGAHRPYGVGNHVVIRTGSDVYVVIGHLRHGSVRVRAGDAVRADDPLGQVGNSGWTERPHLHMQAMRAPSGDWWHGEPVPMRFDGRFLVKNQVVRVEARS
jgi:hypothetical protein